jgi:opacity protein-like surface antigen
MKKTGLLLIGLAITIFVHGQTVKIQAGTSISNLDYKLKGIDVAFFEKPLIGYSLFAGIDYFDKQYFNLSSNMGMIRKGGKADIPLMDIGVNVLADLTEKATLDYLSINTTMDFKYPVKETISPFISFGPRFDYLLHSSRFFDTLSEVAAIKKSSFGLILGGGLKYDLSNLQFGLRADYYLDFSKKIADWTFDNPGTGGSISVNTFTINLTIGYRLK